MPHFDDVNWKRTPGGSIALDVNDDGQFVPKALDPDGQERVIELVRQVNANAEVA